MEVKIDRAIYVADVKGKTYRYLGRNQAWREPDPTENERNKRRLDGYARIFPDGRRKVFTYRPPYTRERGGSRCHPPRARRS